MATRNVRNSLQLVGKRHYSTLQEKQLKSFKIFNDAGAKFRVAIINKCNMNCFFCHNEGMKNPRQPGDKTPIKKSFDPVLSTDQLIKLMNDFCELEGKQLNITGGEPLANKDIVSILKSIKKRKTVVILNSNVMLANRLLSVPVIDTVDAIYASLHTTRDSVFKEQFGVKGADLVMKNILLLKQHGYKIQINLSFGEYNKDGFEQVLEWVTQNKINLKIITLIRSEEKEKKNQYGGQWANPSWLFDKVETKGLKKVKKREGFGGFVDIFTNANGDHEIAIKNIGNGRLVTDFCNSCKHISQCGEGIYALRSGVDAIWKPCLLNKAGYEAIAADEEGDFKPAILKMIDKMVGNWDNHKFLSGSPL